MQQARVLLELLLLGRHGVQEGEGERERGQPGECPWGPRYPSTRRASPQPREQVSLGVGVRGCGLPELHELADPVFQHVVDGGRPQGQLGGLRVVGNLDWVWAGHQWS